MKHADDVATTTNRLLLKATCLCWLIAKCMSWKLWTMDRFFPLVPPFSFLAVPSWVHIGLLVISLVLLVALLAGVADRRLLVALLLVECFSCLLDQHRWQPWEFQYLFMVLVFCWNHKKQEKIAPAWLFMLVATYAYSGFHKLNPVFIREIWHGLILVKALHMRDIPGMDKWVYRAGYLVGLAEAGLGISLLFRSCRRIVAWGLIAFHIVILLLFSPLLLDYNMIIRPWNAAMIGWLVLLVVRRPAPEISWKYLLQGWNNILLLVWGVLPVLNFFGCWDHYLSAEFYTGKVPEMYVKIKRTQQDIVLRPFADKRYSMGTDSLWISVQQWSMKEMNVPPYPEIRVYKAMKTQLQQIYPDMSGSFWIEKYQHGRKERETME